MNATAAPILLTVVLATASHAEDAMFQADYHVAPEGRDTHPGTAGAPFATLERARDAVRAKIAAGLTGNVLVLVRGGAYPLAKTLVFGPEDSGTDRHSITYAPYPGEKVVLSGGRRITGWKKGAAEIWTTEVPEVKAGKWCFRQLFVNGRRAIRARTPNADAGDPWWSITSCNFGKDKPAPPDVPVVLSLSGRIAGYGNPEDVEFVHICNNDMGRKRLAGVSAAEQKLTLATPNRWNPRDFKFDWYLSIPTAGGQGQMANRCYLENALEMLDRPGEWYLDRKTGVLSYWPRPGEDLAQASVIAPAVQNTLLAFSGTPERPVRNLHIRGVHCEYVDWTPPEWGYMGLFCCNVAIQREPHPGHRFIDAAVEYSHARSCSFRDGGVSHAGAMGLCLREGTSQITIEGNEIGDLGGGGIGLGGCNVAAGYTQAAPPPQPGEYMGYRIANNHIHHCGADYYGAVGIALFLAQDAVIAHNLIHDTAYFGIGVAGSQAGSTPFAGGNRIEYNHIHDAMKVTVDGASLYITFAHGRGGTLVRGNVIHDTAPGRGKAPSAGIYLDCNCSGAQFEQNVVFRNNAAGPLILNIKDAEKTNTWADNLFQPAGSPPAAFLEALEACVGPEPAYRKPLFHSEPKPWTRHVLSNWSALMPVSAIQFDLPTEGRGVVQVFMHLGGRNVSTGVILREVDAAASYDLQAWRSPVAPANVWGPGQMPMLGAVSPVELAALGAARRISGRDLLDKGLALKLGTSPQVVWIAYRKAR